MLPQYPNTCETALRSAAQDARLTYRARGVLVAVLAQPDNWTTAEQLARRLGEGRSAMLTVLRELREAGYARQVTTRDEQGRLNTRTYVYNAPQDGTAR
jgi:biotin operon repressor